MDSTPVIIDSWPPPNDSLWHCIQSEGFEVIVYDRNFKNEEKKVDVELVATMLNTIGIRILAYLF